MGLPTLIRLLGLMWALCYTGRQRVQIPDEGSKYHCVQELGEEETLFTFG
jgi:hypothetical protein